MRHHKNSIPGTSLPIQFQISDQLKLLHEEMAHQKKASIVTHKSLVLRGCNSEVGEIRHSLLGLGCKSSRAARDTTGTSQPVQKAVPAEEVFLSAYHPGVSCRHQSSVYTVHFRGLQPRAGAAVQFCPTLTLSLVHPYVKYHESQRKALPPPSTYTAVQK